MTNKTKLFLILVFGFVFLFAQHSFGAYVKHDGSTTDINDTDTNIIDCSTFKSDGTRDVWNKLSFKNEFCLFTLSNVANKWDKLSNIGLKINQIKIPYYLAENLWKTIDTTASSISNKCNDIISEPGAADNRYTYIASNNINNYLTIPKIYDNVKTEIIRSCLPGSINTTKYSDVTAFCQHYVCSKDFFGFTKCKKNAVTLDYNSDNHPTWTFPGCGPLSSSMSMSIKTNDGKEYLAKSPDDSENTPARAGIGQQFTLSWNLSNPSASCELKGFDANDANSVKTIIAKIAPAEVGVDVRTEAITPKTGSTTYGNPKMGIYTYTYTCAGVLDGKNNPPSDTDKPIIVEKKVFVGPIPNEPKINSFTIKKADGTSFPTTNIGGENVPTITQTDSFKICWNTTTENPEITVRALKDLAQIKKFEITPTTTNPNILTACLPAAMLPSTDAAGVSPIGLWNYELEVGNSIWSDKGLGIDTQNIALNVVPIDPVIEKFEVLDKDGNTTTSVLTNAKIRLHWKVKNTKNVSIEGSNFTGNRSAIGGSTDVDDYSSTSDSKWLPIDENDPAPLYTYTLKAYDLFYPNRTTNTTIDLQRRQPGAPTISKFEFNPSSVTKKTAGRSGLTDLTWIVSDAKSITVTGPGLPFRTVPYKSTDAVAISIDNSDISVSSEGIKYTITACPTATSNINCSARETILKVYSSDAFGANLYADDAIIRVGNSTMLRWDVAQNDKIKSYSIISSSGDVNLTESAETGLKLFGEIEITPRIKTTYTLNIQSFDPKLMPDFSTSATVGTTDKNSPLIEFSADKTEINKGEAVVLTWSAQDAKEVVINNNIGSVAKQGSTTIYPDFTTLYILTAKSAQPGVIPDSEKTVQIKVITPGFEGLEKADEWTNPTDLKTQYGLTEEAEARAKLGILDLKVNGVDGPITVASPANITLSWNLDKYCLATGSWLTVKTAAGTENMTLKKNGKYTYNLYCPGTGSDSVEVIVTGGQGGLLDNLLGKNGNGSGENGKGSMPIAEVAVSTDKIVFSTDARVIKGKEVELFIRADKDIDDDGKASRDQNGEWGSLLSNGGGCLYNTKLTKDLQFDGGVQSPKSPQDCNASLGKFTFNDEPGTYQYGVFKLVQNDGKFSNIAYITITVDGPPAPNSAPTMDFRINGKDDAEQILGTPANYYLTWDVASANSCLATGSWNGIKPIKGIQNFLKSSQSDPVYTLTCENDLGITAKTIALKIVESPTCAFTAMPPILNKQSAFVTESELYWKCNYTDECNLSPNATNAIIKTYGSLRVSPDQTTTYILTCNNSGIFKSFEAKVEVK